MLTVVFGDAYFIGTRIHEYYGRLKYGWESLEDNGEQEDWWAQK